MTGFVTEVWYHVAMTKGGAFAGRAYCLHFPARGVAQQITFVQKYLKNGKPFERAGRKARGLKPQGHDSPAASVSILP